MPVCMFKRHHDAASERVASGGDVGSVRYDRMVPGDKYTHDRTTCRTTAHPGHETGRGWVGVDR